MRMLGRLLGRLLAVLLLLGGAVVALAGPAAACPRSDATLPQQAKRADAVFTGTVSDRTRKGPGVHYAIDVRRIYKGDVGAQADVVTQRSPHACGLPDLREGTDYVFFATEDGGDLTISSRGGTAAATDARVHRVGRLLGAGTSPTPVEPERASFTAVAGPRTTTTRLAAPGVALVIVGLLGLLLAVGLGRRKA